VPLLTEDSHLIGVLDVDSPELDRLMPKMKRGLGHCRDHGRQDLSPPPAVLLIFFLPPPGDIGHALRTGLFIRQLHFTEPTQ